MLIHPKFGSLLARGGVYLESTNGEGDDLGGGSDAEKLAAQKAEADKVAKEKADKEAADAEAERKAKEAGAGGDKKPTDEEARLLKEVMKRKESEKALQTQLAELTATVKAFEGIDVEEVRKQLAEKKLAEEKALADKGDWERLKTRMAEEHASQLTPLQKQIEELQTQLGQRDSQINEMTVGASFTQSEFINKELVLPPSKARTVFGSHFELEDGKVVGYDRPRGDAKRTPLVDAYGNALPFDAALRKIVDADADSKNLLKSGIKSGAGSTTTNGKVPPEKTEKTSLDKIGAGLSSLGIQLNSGNL